MADEVTNETETTTEATTAPKPRAPKRKSEAEYKAKYPNIVDGTLIFVDPENRVTEAGGHEVPSEIYDSHSGKQVVLINTVDENDELDGNTRWVATSDLHHVKTTAETSDRIRKQRAKDRRAANRAAKQAQEEADKAANAETEDAEDAEAEEAEEAEVETEA